MGRRHRRTTSHSRHTPRSSPTDAAPLPTPAYVLEWSPHNRRRYSLCSPEELRAELLPQDAPGGVSKLLVVREASDDVADMLRSAAGVEPGFLEAHAAGGAYRPRGRARRAAKWWNWAYPELRNGDGQRFARVSLWLSSRVPVLLVCRGDCDTGGLGSVLREREVASPWVGAHTPGRYGAVGVFPKDEYDAASALEDDLWDALRGEDSLSDMVGELVYEQWVEFLDAAKLAAGPARLHEAPWAAVAALEQNLDDAKYFARQGRAVEPVDTAACMDLLQRVQFRITLSHATEIRPHPSSSRALLPSGAPVEKDANDRSLDRIAYLGGLLLPVTVVASVLAIEGDYGPEGGNFWVFWVASLIASVLAVLVIYVDQVGMLEVWMEVAGGAGGPRDDGDDQVHGEGGGREHSSRAAPSPYFVQRWADGSRARTWRRGRLGWGGAVKKISGYYKWRGTQGIVFGRPEELVRLKGWIGREGV